MIGDYFSFNGKFMPVIEAKVSVDDLSFVYGYGVYENLKAEKGKVYFCGKHVDRLFGSAEVLGLKLQFNKKEVIKFIERLAGSVGQESFNIKILLMGKDDFSDIYIFGLNRKYISKKAYKDGVKVITSKGERLFPKAKTLNMLMSFLAYKEAQKNKAFDSLLVDNEGFVREGTRTNFFFTDGVKIYTPPKEEILEGVTRTTLIEALDKKGVGVEEKKIRIEELWKYRGYFLTSTSAKVLPIKDINGQKFEVLPIINEIIRIYDDFLSNWEQDPSAE